MWKLELSGCFSMTSMGVFRKKAGSCFEEELLKCEEFCSQGPELIPPLLCIGFCDVYFGEGTDGGLEHCGGPSAVPDVRCIFVVIPDVLMNVAKERWYPSLRGDVVVHGGCLNEGVNFGTIKVSKVS